jgi:cytochrome c oxidase subunit IV
VAQQITENKGPSASHADAHAHGPGRYFVVWILLLIFTATTVITGRMDLGDYNIILALVIASIKAALVVLFFMHMTEAAGTNRLVFVVSIVFTVVMMVGVFGDLLTRNPMTLPTGSPPVQVQAE